MENLTILIYKELKNLKQYSMNNSNILIHKLLNILVHKKLNNLKILKYFKANAIW